ncbi:TonB-dependent receptor [Rhodohalobacter sp. SW132]|uniref:TonB-dependent receptor n=1 Tax=Rhodohalobacter sp. SW132 TaxID=2293433 RepID=UPI000E285C48|nr:TonB-dependent receptor [Rhodohalobacter sp. SW132]REL33482.1 TonB-dependent receptor [Rhodohalobacter sp. SW132]
MQASKKIIFTGLFFFLFQSYLFAQGTLRGVITDQADGQTLVGATVIIIGTSTGTATNLEGRYQLRRIPAGEVQLRFSYIGYESKTLDVTIPEEGTVTLDVELRAASVEGEEVTITSQALGQIVAINQQRASNTIVNIVSEEKIRELPDANAAESIGRLSGVSLGRSGGEANKVILRGLSDKYLNVTVDGVKLPATDALGRGVDLSSISQNSLAGIELHKAVTPDKDADAIAGSINLVTRKAPEESEFRLTAKGGYNNILESFGQYDFDLKYGGRFFDNFLGIQINGNLESKIRNNERINIGYDTSLDQNRDYLINNLHLQYVDENRSRKGVGVIFDFNLPADGNIKLSSMYSTTTRDFLTHSRNYPQAQGGVTYSFRDRENQIDIFSNSIMGENTFLGLDANWILSYSRSESKFPYDYEANFFEPSSSGVSGMRSGMPIIKENPEQFADFAYNNFENASISDAFYRTQDNSDAELTARLDLAREYSVSNAFSGEIKVGGKFATKDRSNVNTRTFAPYRLGYWREFETLPNGSVARKDFDGSHFEDFYQSFLNNPGSRQPSFSDFLHSDPRSRFILDDFNMNPLIDRDRMRQWYSLNKNGINQAGTNVEYHHDPSAEANTYDITESVTAGYLMNTFNFGQIVTAIVGARVEHENHDYSNTYSPRQIGGFPVPEGSTRDTSSTYSETIILPHLHLNIAPTNFMNIRLAAFRALARPDFNMRLLSYFAWRDSETGGDRILVLGNPKLKTAKAWNYEVSTSFYGNRLGLFTVSAFYKSIDDMYHMLNGINTSGDTLINSLGLDWSSPHRANYNLFVPYNSPETSEVYGLELDHQINLTWLPGLLGNFVLSYNASLVKSNTTLFGATTDTVYVPDPILGERAQYQVRTITFEQEMQDQPELFGNVSLGYDIGGFSGRISAFHQSEFYSSFSPTGRSDRIQSAYTRLDLALKYRFTDFLTVVGNVNNLTSIRESNIQHNRQIGYKIPRSTESYGLTFDFGVQINL